MFVLVNYNSNLTKAEYKEQIGFEPGLKISFQAYQLMNSKSQPLTVSDMFVKMLTCTTGISLTKAQEIVKKYPTPLR
jgi:crossover junction endonuclease MUS81